MNEEEKSLIRTEWRDGKYKTLARLEELGQLHACAVEEICRAVGVDPAKYKGAVSTRRVARSYDQSVKDDVVKAVLLEGLAYKDAAEKFGVPQGNISVWVRKAKEKQARVMAEADRLAAEADGPAGPPAEEKQAPRQAHDKPFAQRIMAEMRVGIEGLHAFIDGFAGVDILSDEERDVLERILHTASGFRAGVETGLVLAGWDRLED